MKILAYIYTDDGTCIISWDDKNGMSITNDIEIDNHNAEVAMDILKLVVKDDKRKMPRV